MQNGNVSIVPRRSSRIPAALPIRVTSLAGTYFSEVCKTLVVNAHGCAMLSPVKFDAGVPLRFHSKDGRQTTAHVVSCQPAGPDNRAWRLGARLDQPDNFWGLSEHPQDWALPSAPIARHLPLVLAPAVAPPAPKLTPANQSPEALLDLVAKRLEAPLRKMIAESIAPLQTEVAGIKETMARREANPSRFEVSLSQIPAQLEEQLEVRLKKEIGPKALEESRQQYAALLESAKASINQRIVEGAEKFRRRAAEELKTVENQAQEMSAQISAETRAQLRRGLEEFQQRLLDGGNSLKRLSEELLEFLQQSLNEEHHAHRMELEGLRASLSAESAQLRKDVESLHQRIATLDDSARSLESGLDKRLGQMAGHILQDARTQLENAAAAVLGEMTGRTAKLIQEQLTEATENLAAAQTRAIDSVTESLNQQATNALQTFEHSADEMAKASVEAWRQKLASSLNVAAKGLGEQL